MKETPLPLVYLYSDGGANPNPGPGAYGVIMKCGEHQRDFSQGYTRTTNNRMELLGVITGLKNLKKKSRVIITTDSQYTINGIEKWWARKWQANNWFRIGSHKAQNWDLWEILLQELDKHEVEWEWIKGHNGHFENELCDELATLAMKRDNLLIDTGFRETPPEKKTSKTQTPLPWETLDENCKKCGHTLEKKIPKHTKKTLEKAYYYEYYHHCPSCKTNYMLEKAKRDIKTLKV